MLPFPVFVTLLSRRFLDPPKSLQVFFATFATPALKSPLRQSSQLYGPTDQPTRFPLFPHPVNMAHTRKPASPSPSIVYSTLLCIPGKMDAAAPTPSRRRPLLFPSAARRPLITPLNAMLTKNKGVCISTSPAIASELSTRDNPNPSVPVFVFNSRPSIEDPGPVGTVDLFCRTLPLTSSNNRKSFISNVYRKSGSPAELRAAALLTTHYPLPTTHFPNHFATLCVRGNHDR
jgi:hypothetical protein